MSTNSRRLLGRLAELGWFAGNGEVAATRSLAILLEDEALRAGFVAWIGDQAGVDLSSVDRFVGEAVNDEGTRPDLEGLDANGWPLLVAEAKFGAALPQSQVDGYLRDQARRLQRVGVEAGVLALIVPESRLEEARTKVAAAALSDVAGTTRHEFLVLDWDGVLDSLESSLADVGESPDSLLADVHQLRELCDTLGGLVIAPLGAASRGPSWRTRETDYALLVDRATKAVPTGWTGPMQSMEKAYRPRRYFGSGFIAADGREASAALGVHVTFADEGGAPLWLRFHRGTPGFAEIRDLLAATRLAGEARTDDGHLWLPIHVAPDKSGPDLVEDLAIQMNEVLARLR